MRPALRATIAAVAACLVLSSCTEAGSDVVPDGGPDIAPSATPEPAAPGSTRPASGNTEVRLVDEDRADLHLWVSNQSFRDDPVVVGVTVDGVPVVDQAFEVGSQHSWQLFALRLPPGPHVLEAVADTGATLQRRFTTPEKGRRHAVLDYWSSGDTPRQFQWRIQRQPVAFM